MILLARSLIIGYVAAACLGGWLYGAGYGAAMAVFVAWIGGAILSVGLITLLTWSDPVSAAATAADTKDGMTPAEYAKWDADLMAEAFETDLAADLAEREDDNRRDGTRGG